MSHKDDINVLSGRMNRILGMLQELDDDLGVIYDEIEERTCENVDTDDDCYFMCSRCRCSVLVEYKSGGYGVPSYCPNCGAKVVGE